MKSQSSYRTQGRFTSVQGLLLTLALVVLMLAITLETGFADPVTNLQRTPGGTNVLSRAGVLSELQKRRSRISASATGAQRVNTASNLVAQPVRSAQSSKRRVVLDETGANYRNWKSVADEAASLRGTGGRASIAQSSVSRVMEVETGMNYWDGQQWSPSEASFVLTEDAFVADRVQHRTRLNGDLNVVGAVTTTLVDGTQLRSTPVAIALYDPNDGRLAVIATLTNSSGVLVASNQVVYPDAFSDGVCANVVYTLQKGSFEQDVVLTGRLDPLAYGFPTNAQIQIITEFYNPPQPETLRRPIYVEQNNSVRRRKVSPDVVDEVLGFSDLVIGTGKAYTPPTVQDTNGTQTVVAKEFRRVPEEGRTFLIESVDCSAVQKALQGLPECGSGGKSAQLRRSKTQHGYASLPKLGYGLQAQARPKRALPQLAQAGNPARSGVVIDYIATLDPLSSTTVFRGDTTYLVTGTVYRNGAVTIEGGAVFKYKTDASIVLNNSVTCKTSSYRPAVFTCVSDDSVGESLWDYPDSGWTDSISSLGYANPAILCQWIGSPSLNDLRFRYAKEAIRFAGAGISATLSSAQIVNCVRGVVLVASGSGSGSGSGINLTINNSLLNFVTWALVKNNGSGSGSGLSASINLYHCTVDNATVLANEEPSANYFPVTFKNSVLAHIGSLGNGYLASGTYNGFYACSYLFGNTATRWVIDYVNGSESPFQVSGGGSHYLKADSSFRTKGATTGLPTTLLPSFKTKTTQPPVILADQTEVAATEDLVLQRQAQVPRYISGAPDLGYYYDALDYTVGGVMVGGRLVVAPGTAIGVRGGWVGFVAWENSTIVSQGTPVNPITYANACGVQEDLLTYAGIVAVEPSYSIFADYTVDRAPVLSFRFSEFYSLGADYVIASGYSGAWGPSWISSMDLNLQDCKLRGGRLILAPAEHAGLLGARTSVLFANSSFERILGVIVPNAENVWNLDFSFQAYNNLFYDGTIQIYPSLNTRGSWVVKDNLFDNVAFTQDLSLAWLLDYDYNGYTCHNPCLSGLPQDWTTHLISDAGLPNSYAQHEIVLPSNLNYQPGTFGSYYLPTGPVQLRNAGSRSPAEAGLYQYTTRLDQVKDGTQAKVNIGLHYVAANVTTGQALDSNSDGVPDFIADADGNGLVDAVDSSLPPTPVSPWTRAHNDVFQVSSGTPTELSILGNDTDSQNRPFTVFFPQPSFSTSHGTVAPSADFRKLVYTSSAGYSGVDIFTYAAVNDFNHETSAQVTVFVNQSGNQPPVAVEDTATMAANDTTIPIYPLANDTDPNGHTLSIYSVGSPQLGSVAIVGSRIDYTRPTSTAGEDVFTYVVTDGHFGMAVGTIRVTRNTGANHAPVATSYATTAVSAQPVNLTLPATDADNNSLTYAVVVNPQHGTLAPGSQPNKKIYTSQAGYTGPDYLTFTASDGTLQSSGGISINVQRGNNPPVALDANATVVLNEPLTKTFIGYDWELDYLTYRITTPPVHGTVAVQGDGPEFIYTPALDYIGNDTFGFTVNDGKEDSAEAWIQLNVTPLKIVTLTGTIAGNYTLKGNTTYYVPSVVTFNGNVTIEGGMVVKFAYHNPGDPGPKLIFNGSIQCETSPYRPAIFTGEDDDTVGATLETSWHQIYGWNYAEVALELRATGGTELKHIRVSHARTAIHYPLNSGPASDAVRHIQMLDCEKGFWIEGNSSFSRQLTVDNCLMGVFQQAFFGENWNVEAQHLTVANGEVLAPDPAVSTFNLQANNSVIVAIGQFFVDPNIQSSPSLGGTHNGFVTGGYTFGADPVFDDSPLATPASIANLQGGCYLRSGSAFVDAGTTISASLAADFAHMTTSVPELLNYNVNSSQTVGPTIPRDTDTPDLGYHYPVVDYVLNGATVNNATLNLDQGTVLAYTAPFVNGTYEWGLRLNPGGRLNVNGVPTNRVVFARLEAIQESPTFGAQNYNGPLITFKGVFLPTGTMVTPLPEARFHYADFPALAGVAVHFGPLTYNQDQTYDMVSTLELDGCLFQGGMFNYEAGGPAGRTFNLRNTIFERSALGLQNSLALHGGNEEQLTNANNLFYDCDIWLSPVSGANWTFMDNIFDQVALHGNGPVAANHHNAYVGMNTRLSPAAPTTTDPNLSSLVYQTGTLGSFYLPSSASLLIDAGSRTAGEAGLFHFTTQTDNSKEAIGQVDIGPHYVAIGSNGPEDGDGDEVPDYSEDRNGNGTVESGETDWQNLNSDDIAFLGSYPGPLAGLVELNFWAADLHSLESITLSIDGQTIQGFNQLSRSFAQPLTYKLDTRLLANGNHTLQLKAAWPGDLMGVSITSDAITVNVQNSYCYPDWKGGFEGDPSKFDATASATDTDYSIYVYDSSYATSYSPSPVHILSGVTGSDGSIAANWDLQGYDDPNVYPTFYSATAIDEQNQSAQPAQVNPASPQPKDNYPTVGKWAVAVLDWIGPETRNYSSYEGNNNSFASLAETTGGILPVAGQYENGGTRLSGKPFSIRLMSRFPNLKPSDWQVLYHLAFRDPEQRVRNFFYLGHGSESTLAPGENGGEGGLDSAVIAATLNNLQQNKDNQRYRFVWLDGCETAGGNWPDAFALGKKENKPLAEYTVRPGIFIGWDNKPGIYTKPLGSGAPPNGYMNSSGYSVVQEYEYFRARFLLRLSSQYNYSIQEAWNDSFYLMPNSLVDHFKRYGYWGLHLGQYNNATDWSQ